MRAIIWMDSRGNKAIRKVAGGPVNVLGYDPRKILRWVQVTGGAPGLSGKDPVAHILFIRDAFPDVYRDTATFLEPVDYLNLQLTGVTWASFDSIAAHWVTDNRAIDRVAYDDRLLELTGLDRAKLPDLVPPGTIIGAAHRRRRPPISASRPGCRCRWAPATCTRRCSAPGRWPTSPPTSTSGPRRGSRPTSRSRRRRPPPTWPRSPPPWPAATSSSTSTRRPGPASPSSATTWAWPTDFDAMNAMVDSVAPGSGRVLFTPWLNGERSPVDDHTIRGRLPQPVAGHHPGPDGPGRLRGGGLQLEVAARGGREVRRPSARLAGLHRRRGQLRPVVPRSTPTCWAGRSARWPIRCWPTSGVPALITLMALGRVARRGDPGHGGDPAHLHARPVDSRRVRRPVRASSSTLYKQTKGIFKRLNRF